MRKGQFLWKAMQEKQLKYAKKLIKKLKHPLELYMLWFFSNKKNFCKDLTISFQNNRNYAASSRDMTRLNRQSFQQQVWSSVLSILKLISYHSISFFLPQKKHQWLLFHSDQVNRILDRSATTDRWYMWQVWKSENFVTHTIPDIRPLNSVDWSLSFFVLPGGMRH